MGTAAALQCLMILLFTVPDQLMVSKRPKAERLEQSATQRSGEQTAPPWIKEEEDELCKEEGGRRWSPQEVEGTRVTCAPVRTDGEERAGTSQLQQPGRRDGTAGADAGGAGAPAAPLSPPPAGSLVWEGRSKGEPVGDEDLGRAALASCQRPPGPVQVCGGAQAGPEAFGCSVCGSSFSQDKHLKKHMRLHSRGARWSCSVCQKSFLWKTVLEAHMRIHTGEKPYSCSVCGARFTHGSNLASHRKTHWGVKPHTCSVCNASFSRRHHLSRHMKIHTGEKPFGCYFCGKRFRERAYLRRHLNSHAAGGL